VVEEARARKKDRRVIDQGHKSSKTPSQTRTDGEYFKMPKGKEGKKGGRTEKKRRRTSNEEEIGA